MKYLIVGRVGTGKEKLAEEMKKRGMTVDADVCGKGGCLMADAYITDLGSLKEMAYLHPECSFHIVFLEAPQKIRKENALSAGMQKKAFERKESEENIIFLSFERNWIKAGCYPPNIAALHRFSEEESSYKDMSASLAAYLKKFDNLKTVVELCIEEGVVKSNAPQSAAILKQHNREKREEDISIEAFVDIILTSREGFNELLDAYLCRVKLNRRNHNHAAKKRLSVTGQLSMLLDEDGKIMMY